MAVGGYLVEPDDERALGSGDRTGAPARPRAHRSGRARQAFSVDAIVDRYEALFNSIAHRAVAA